MKENDFFARDEGQLHRAGWRRYGKLLRAADRAADIAIRPALRHALAKADEVPPQKILLTAVRTPARPAELDDVIRQMSVTRRHAITVDCADMQPMGKFDNINTALARHDLAAFDWVLVTDDDVELPPRFTDLLIYFAYRNALKIAMPAHRFFSYASFRITERHFGTAVRQTDFVEIGPVSLLHRDSFASLLPSPSLRWAWGLDLFWSEMARRHGWKIGVVDATPIRHTRPVGSSYDGGAALAEAIEFLDARQVAYPRSVLSARNTRLQ